MADRFHGAPQRRSPSALADKDILLVRTSSPTSSAGSSLDWLPDSEPKSAPNFDWIVAPKVPLNTSDRDHLLSPLLEKHFQARIQENRARRAELQVAREEEALRAERAANRLAYEARKRQMRDKSRENTVSFLWRIVLLVRSVVLLAGLVWTLLFISLSATDPHLASDIGPNTVVQLMSKLIGRAEAGLSTSAADIVMFRRPIEMLEHKEASQR